MRGCRLYNKAAVGASVGIIGTQYVFGRSARKRECVVGRLHYVRNSFRERYYDVSIIIFLEVRYA